MPKISAGLLMYRNHPDSGRGLEVLLVHPGGPLWKNQSVGAWTIPKGEIDPDEGEFVAAQREFFEETGFPQGPPYDDLGWIRQKGGKRVRIWAFEGDCDLNSLVSNQFEMIWPPRSGLRRAFPEVDRANFFTINEARIAIMVPQREFLDRLTKLKNGK